MDSHQLEYQVKTESKIDVDNEAYLKIWQADQAHTSIRWTVTTFFMSVSFAILGFSFQSSLVSPAPFIIRIVGLIIYWLAFVMFWHNYEYNKFLRSYLVEMEKSGRTTIDVQSKALLSPAASAKLSTTRLLCYFGLIYVIGVILLQVLSL